MQLAPEGSNIGAQLKGGLPYQPWAADLRNARRAENLKNAPDAQYLPLSILQMHTSPFPRKMLQVPGLVAILYEKNMEYRQTYILLDTELLEYSCLENQRFGQLAVRN